MILQMLLPFFLGISGIAGGIALYYIAREEASTIRPSLQWLRSALLTIFIVGLAYAVSPSILMQAVVLGIGVALFILVWKLSTPFVEIFPYIFFITAYFLLHEQRTLIASLVFLYGLPTGTVIWHDRQKR